VRRFFAARAMYERYEVPWKRGLLFVGPPGNGKTHAVKGLINALALPCLYVKTFRMSARPDEYGVREVFVRARTAAPCILVLEDLDALVTPGNRSFFLNEMDGFAGNAGILTVATTNHPEQLDPAIRDRPSRFDRTYRFDLPAVAERQAYMAQWNASLQPALRVSAPAAARIAERTEGFSFAYLKELFLSAMMRWMVTPQPGAMDQVLEEQVDVLRAQMASAAAPSPEDARGAG
jgi:AAA+ superfamily predicted ATPase